MDEERWLPVPGYESLFSVSDHGRIRREVTRTSGKAGTIRKIRPDREGYLSVGLTKPGEVCRTFRVHRLVCAAFHGLPEGLLVNHKDGNTSNNLATNLEAVTHRENALHAYRELGRLPTGSKLTEDEVVQLRQERATGDTLQVLASRYRVTQTTICHLVTGRTWVGTGGPTTPARPICGRRVTTAELALEIRERAARGETFKAISKDLGMSNVNVANIACGKIWQHVGGPISPRRDGAERKRLGIPNHAEGVRSNRQSRYRMP